MSLYPDSGVCCMAFKVLRAVMHAFVVVSPLLDVVQATKPVIVRSMQSSYQKRCQATALQLQQGNFGKFTGNTIGHTCKDQERIRRRCACPPSNCATTMSLAGQTFRMATSRGAAARPLMRQALRHRVSRNLACALTAPCAIAND